MTLQRYSRGAAGPATAPPIVHEVLHSPGSPLDAATRAFFEPGFGHDFSRVRVHTDSKAAESARAVNAVAYTVGRDVVFGAGQYQPHAAGGRRLLGHELTHVVQQHCQVPTTQLRVGPSDDAYEREANHNSWNLTPGNASAPSREQSVAPVSVQRSCLAAEIGHPAGCTSVTGDVGGEHYLFDVNCDTFKPGFEKKLRDFADTLTSGGSVKIHGFASEEGDPVFNENLSCARAIKGQEVINGVLVPKGVSVGYSLFLHGATAGNRDDRRSITIDWLPAGPAPSPTPSPEPTPDRPVFFCSKPVALGRSHAFFRVGGSGPGNSTFELEHDELGDHCRCGIQGLPTRDYPEDRDSTDAMCIPAPGITESCLVSSWNSYPVGKYCALGPNSNTYARFLAEKCGGTGLKPPGKLPGFEDVPPAAGTGNPAADARLTFLPGGCGTVDCKECK